MSDHVENLYTAISFFLSRHSLFTETLDRFISCYMTPHSKLIIKIIVNI